MHFRNFHCFLFILMVQQIHQINLAKMFYSFYKTFRKPNILEISENCIKMNAYWGQFNDNVNCLMICFCFNYLSSDSPPISYLSPQLFQVFPNVFLMNYRLKENKSSLFGATGRNNYYTCRKLFSKKVNHVRQYLLNVYISVTMFLFLW